MNNCLFDWVFINALFISLNKRFTFIELDKANDFDGKYGILVDNDKVSILFIAF